MNILKKYLIKTFFFSLLLLSPLFALVCEDAEDKQVKRWKILDNTNFSKIDNIPDRAKASRVMQFFGEGTKSIYALDLKAKSKKIKAPEKLEWEMNYREDFVVIVKLNTTKGKRYLIYTPGDEQSDMQYGLGEESMDGQWHTYRRNLKNDLEHYEFANKILSVNTFVVKGSGRIDNIKIFGPKKFSKKSIKRSVKKKKKVRKKILKKKNILQKHRVKKEIYPEIKKMKKNKDKNSMPTIQMRGANPLYLKKGDSYLDPGVVAMDSEDGTLEISTIEMVNPYIDGEYSVIYMATDSTGNSVVKTRYVIVGNLKKAVSKSKVTKEKIEVVKSEEKTPDGLQLDKEMLDILKWEKELELAERKIHEEDQTLDKYKNIKK